MPEPYLLSIPYAKLKETRTNARYDWKNVDRQGGSFVILQHTLKGAGMFAMNGAEHVVGEGFAFLTFIPEPSRYYYPSHFDEPWVFQWLNFYGDFAMRLWREFRDHFGLALPLPLNSPAARLLREMMELIVRQRHPDHLLVGEMAYQFYLAWWRQLQEQQLVPHDQDPVKEAERFCRQHFRRPLAVKEIAAHVGLTREHFTRLFQERHQVGPAAYLRSLRLAEAVRLRRTTQMPLTELAMRTGFPSARQLSKHLQLLGA